MKLGELFCGGKD